jgi:hypothetical protein
LRQSQQHLQGQQERLTDAYLNGVISLPEYQQRRQIIEQQIQTGLAQAQQLEAQTIQHDQLQAMSRSLAEFCRQVQQGLAAATFEQKRQLVELLIDRVVVSGDAIEIRYVIPTNPGSYHTRFCHLRSDYCLEKSVKTGERTAHHLGDPLCQTTPPFGQAQVPTEDGGQLFAQGISLVWKGRIWKRSRKRTLSSSRLVWL